MNIGIDTMTNNDDGTKKPFNKAAYMPFGDLAETAHSQGFYPQTSWFNNGIVYANTYSNAFNGVDIPDQPGKKGNVALIGYPNKTFDIVIRDKDGNIEHTINKGVSPEFVQDYITNNQSVVAQRNNAILNGTNIDKPNINGMYVGINY